MRLLQVPFCGVAKGRNLGIAGSKGEIVSILDADDASLPRRLARQVALLSADPSLLAVGSGVVWRNEITGKEKAYALSGEPRPIRTLLLAGFDPIPHSTLTYRRSAYDAAGGYSERMEKGEDYELLLRLLSRGRIGSVAEPLVRCVVRADSHTFTHRPKGRDVVYFTALIPVMRALDGMDGTPPLPVERIEKWLDSIGPEGVFALLARWALEALKKNWFRLDAWGYRFLVARCLAWGMKRRGPFTEVPGWKEAVNPKALAAFLAR